MVVAFSYTTVIYQSLKEAVADPTYMGTVDNSNNIIMVCADIAVVDSIVYMGTTNKTWHVVICVAHNKL